MNFEDKRREKLRGNAMRVYGDGGDIEKVFRERGQSFALVRYSDKGFKVDGFVPLLPRHMSSENWRNLFWLDTHKLIISGEEFKTLCQACRLQLKCVGSGKGSLYTFECMATPENMLVKLTTRKKGEAACPR